MGYLERPLVQLSEVARVRQTSENQAKILWRDVVYTYLEDRHLRVLSVEEEALRVTLQNAESAISSALNSL
ncbi:hypothetical protein ABIE18_001285 [Arthrobacter sp. 2762]